MAKREFPSDLTPNKRLKLHNDPKLAHMFAPAPNEIDAKFRVSAKHAQADISKVSRELTQQNTLITVEATKQRAVQMSKNIGQRKYDLDTRELKCMQDATSKHISLGIRYRDMVSCMRASHTNQDLKETLTHQLNILTAECQISADLITQLRAAGLAKLNMWRHLYLQFQNIERGEEMARKFIVESNE
jgi:hypothetical protein